VDVTDLGIVATNFNRAGDWAKGDFNGDGVVNVADLGIVSTHFNRSLAEATSPPPPATTRTVSPLATAKPSAPPFRATPVRPWGKSLAPPAEQWHHLPRKRFVDPTGLTEDVEAGH
jgi:hypothetical protein